MFFSAFAKLHVREPRITSSSCSAHLSLLPSAFHLPPMHTRSSSLPTPEESSTRQMKASWPPRDEDLLIEFLSDNRHRMNPTSGSFKMDVFNEAAAYLNKKNNANDKKGEACKNKYQRVRVVLLVSSYLHTDSYYCR